MENAFQKTVLVSEVVHVPLFSLAKVLVSVVPDELVLETVDGPTGVCGQGAVDERPFEDLARHTNSVLF
jgi:hypothetical protein